jgi:selenocysteine lyase/cysteine desulfurase
VVVLGPDPAVPALPLAAFTVTGTPHALVAARLSAEHGIGVRHGCFCAHPYLVRLLGLDPDEIARYWHAVRHHDRRHMPGAIRASAGLSTTDDDIDRLVAAVADIASDRPAPVTYHQDPRTGDFHIDDGVTRWPGGDRALGASCARG